MRILRSTFILFILINLTICFRPTLIKAEEIKLITSTDKALFLIDNMKPGDWASGKVTLQNRSENNFTYNIKSKLKSGSEKMYNEFLLKILDSNGILFNGKLKEFSGIAPRFLKSLNQEDLLFSVNFPSELGNEYQGLSFDVEFRFIIDDQNIDVDINSLENKTNSEDVSDESNSSNLSSEDLVDIQPRRTINKLELNSELMEGQILPSSPTRMNNLLFGGLFLFISGAGVGFYKKRKNKFR
jgi:LPXTG-motif cell wall-anchored protein